MLTNSCIQPRCSQDAELSLKPLETEHSTGLSWSPLHVEWKVWGFPDRKNIYSLDAIRRLLTRLRALWQSGKFLVASLREKMEMEFRQGREGFLRPASCTEINPASPVAPDSRRRLCQLSAMPPRSILLAARCCDCCPAPSTQPPVFITIPAWTAGTAVPWLPAAF